MAVSNGSPCAAALAADAALVARERLATAVRVLALSIEAYRAPLEAYDGALGALWEDDGEVAALAALGEQLVGAETADRLAHQAPVSYRIIPGVLGQTDPRPRFSAARDERQPGEHRARRHRVAR